MNKAPFATLPPVTRTAGFIPILRFLESSEYKIRFSTINSLLVIVDRWRLYHFIQNWNMQFLYDLVCWIRYEMWKNLTAILTSSNLLINRVLNQHTILLYTKFHVPMLLTVYIQTTTRQAAFQKSLIRLSEAMKLEDQKITEVDIFAIAKLNLTSFTGVLSRTFIMVI